MGGKHFYRLATNGERKLETLLETEFDKDNPAVSPDGRWIAYQSMESGRWEVFVAAFPSFTKKRQVSSGGGCQPVWSRNGKEIYFLTLDAFISEVDVKTGAEIETGVPRTLFQPRINFKPIATQYQVSGDGQKFLVLEPGDSAPQEFTVVLNATAGLHR
jgi:eukaryotic-like serine/threonine-protein kinase